MKRYSYSRYERHEDLPGFQRDGQEKLKNSKVCIIGMGGLGAPVAMYLAASGIGRITLVDFDEVRVSNLQRQIIFGEADVGLSKLQSAKRGLFTINSEIDVELINEPFSDENADRIVANQDLVIDCTDNFDTRYKINEFAMKHDKTVVSGSVIFFDGQVGVFKNSAGCYACLYPVQPSSIQIPICTESAVLGPVPGVIGTIMAVETIKELTKVGESLSGSLLTYSGLDSKIDKVKFKKQKNCKFCKGVA